MERAREEREEGEKKEKEEEKQHEEVVVKDILQFNLPYTIFWRDYLSSHQCMCTHFLGP